MLAVVAFLFSCFVIGVVLALLAEARARERVERARVRSDRRPRRHEVH